MKLPTCSPEVRHRPGARSKIEETGARRFIAAACGTQVCSEARGYRQIRATRMKGTATSTGCCVKWRSGGSTSRPLRSLIIAFNSIQNIRQILDK